MTIRLANFTAFILAGVFSLATATFAADAEPDRWQPLRRFIGAWEGTASGEAGTGTATRTYAFVLGGRFINETSVTRYPPQERNKTGEVHEHWGIFSFDGTRKLIVLRHFHVEGFVNTYRQASASEGSASLAFESESFENFSNSWRARESYVFLSDDEFVETFELAAPGKPFQVYTRNHFNRVPR